MHSTAAVLEQPAARRRVGKKKPRPASRCAAEVRRSVKNILEWNAYLPTDCVRAMVQMAWDYTT